MAFLSAFVSAPTFTQTLNATSAHADSTFIVTLTQVGPNVVATGSGTIDLTGLRLTVSTLVFPELFPHADFIAIGPSNTVDVYGELSALSGPSGFGPGAAAAFPSTTTGDSVFLQDFATQLDVPHGYVSGAPLSGSETFDSATLASLGATPGTYTWTWDSGANSFVLKIPTSVPEPGTLLLLVAGTMLMAGRWLGRKLAELRFARL